MRTMKKAENPVHIVGPVGIASLVQNALTLSQTFLPYAITFTELETGKSIDIGVRQGWQISAHPIVHRVPCFGYVFLEKITAAGRFLPETAASLGVPKMKMRELIKDGSVTLADGKVILRHQCLVRADACALDMCAHTHSHLPLTGCSSTGT